VKTKPTIPATPAPLVPQRSKRDLVAIAQRAASSGDLEEAAYAFDKAIEADRRNPDLYFQLAMVQEGLDEIDAAVAALTRALSLKPSMLDAGRSLSRLLSRYRITELDGLTAGAANPGHCLAANCRSGVTTRIPTLCGTPRASAALRQNT
jgi:tetratricopeptide (TPR) repeat protein